MRLKTFRAPNVAAAMAQVRSELGMDALILSTRRTAGGVEVTAALEPVMAPLPLGLSVPHGAPSHGAGAQETVQLDSLRWHGLPGALAERLSTQPLEMALATHLQFGMLDLSCRAPPLLFTGPPGAGKSLTVARLATRLVLGGVAPMVISADAERAGAAEQLGAFTRLLGLTLLVATDGLTLARALARRQEGTPVLIDTAGIDPFRASDQAGIASLAAAAGARTALVLPAGLDVAEAADTAAAFRAAGATAMVATRMDLARRIGSVPAAAAAGLVLTEAGVGPGAADGLVPLTPLFLASRLAPPLRKAA